MRTRAFLEGAAFGYFNQVVVLFAGLWLTPFLLRNLGQGDYGRWLVYLQVLGYALLADFGTVALLPREIAYAAGGHPPRDQSDTLIALMGRTARVVLMQTTIVLVIASGIFFFSSNLPNDFRTPTLIVAAGFVVAFPFRMFSAALEGFQQLRLLGQLRSLIWAASTLTTVVSILLGCKLYSLAFGWLVSQVGFSIASYLQLRKLFPWLVTAKSIFAHSRVVRRDLFRGTWVSVGQVAQILIGGSDLLLVGHILGPAAVVVYSCTGKLLSVLANQPMILINAAMPGLSQMKVAESRETLLRVSTAMGQGMLLAGGAVAVSVLCINKAFIGTWVGSEFFGGTLLTLLFILNMVFRQLDICFAVALFAFGHEKPMAIKALVDGIFCTCFALVLGPLFGLPGVIAGSLISALIVSVPTNLCLLARESRVSALRVLRPYLPWLWRFILLSALAWKISTAHWMVSYPLTAAAGILILLLYCGVMFKFLYTSEVWPYVRPLLSRVRALFPTVGRPSQTIA